MTDLTRPLAILIALGLAAPVLAQTEAPAEPPAEGTEAAPAETEAPAPAEGAETPAAEQPEDDGEATAGAEFSTGQEVGQDGQAAPYTRETFEAWQLNCIRVPEGKEPCQLYQLLSNAEGQAIAEINLTPLPAGGQAVAGATVITPLETLLTEQLTIAVDGGKTKRYPFTFCAAVGCIARVGFTAEDLTAFKSGAQATVTIVPMAAPDQQVTVTVSLKGFTAAFDALAKLQADGVVQ